MTFQINALPPAAFAAYFDMDDADLARHHARRVVVDARPGFPCRISLTDADPGEEVILLNYEHQPAASAFRASHAIYVRQDVEMAQPEPGEVPQMIRLRQSSLRGFDARDEICKAEVVDGTQVSAALSAFFEDPEVTYIHIHNAKLGCFTAMVTRA